MDRSKTPPFVLVMRGMAASHHVCAYFVLTLPKGTHMQFNTWNFYTCEDSGKQMQRFLANPKQKHPNQRFKCLKLFGSFSPQKSWNH